MRTKSLNLIKEIVRELEDEELLKFLNVLISEFKDEGINIENYLEVIKLDDYNFLFPYFEKMNTDNSYIQRRHEANLLILGSLADEIYLLRAKNRLDAENVNELMSFLFRIINNKDCSNILIGRAIWCVRALISLIKNSEEHLIEIFNVISVILGQSNDLSICLVAAQCLTDLSKLLSASPSFLAISSNYNELIINNYNKLVFILSKANDDTFIIPLEAISAQSGLNKELALFIPLNYSKIMIDIYSNYYNHPVIGVKILELIKLWCSDHRSAKTLISLFVPFAIFVFDEFFKSLGKSSNKFEDIKKTVMTTHGNTNLEFKTSLDMLPVFYLFF